MIYPYRCETCGKTEDGFNRIADRDSGAPICCGTATIRQLAAPMVFVPANCAYKCPVTEQVVTSYQQRDRIMKANNLRDANDTPPAYVIEQTKKKTAARQALAAQLPGLPEGMSRERLFTE